MGSVDDVYHKNEYINNNLKEQINYSGRGPICYCIIKPDILCTGNKIPSLINNVSGYTKKMEHLWLHL